jgi:predicted  nucleic acid-binding Zn-ribbon protein
MSYTTVSHCGSDHLKWLKSIEFYESELDMLEERLLEIVKKNNSHEVMAEVEHFQNQFIVQRDNIRDLKHSIRKHDGNVSEDVQKYDGQIGAALVSQHDQLKGLFESFEKVVNELRHEFNQFLAKRM